MEFRTQTNLPENLPPISHDHSMLLMGSCFAENTGKLLLQNKFRCDVNPFGILYNPSSVSAALRLLMCGKEYGEKDLFRSGGCYYSFMHHGAFSDPSPQQALHNINTRLQSARRNLSSLDYLMITFGTSWVYTHSVGGQVVANCHKLPASQFVRSRLSVNDITKDYEDLLQEVFALNPKCKVILTVSPIRHLKDGMHGNQLSKATLLLAADALQDSFPGRVYYFPSYEIIVDELRDYRFYAEDMVHPSAVAVQYIWEKFAECFFSPQTQNIMKECERINKAIAHKPFHKDSEEYKTFLGQIVLKINRLKEKYPNLDVEKELDVCRILLK